ncbi:MAG: ethylbenzene dehydrogenase-related protein [Syntrophobacteraceae bacterium]
MKKTYYLGLMLALIAAGTVWVSDHLYAAAKQTLGAAYVKAAPAGLDDPAWQKAKAIDVPFEGKEKFAGKKASVTTRALYTDDSIYFLFKWKDDTRSVTKDAWEFDGTKWQHKKGNEDRIALLFEISRITNFATRGCAITCHGPAGAPAKEFKFATATAAEKGDLWHWKAARSDPYKRADDTWLTVAGEKTGRMNDAGSGGDVKNEVEDKSKPRYMQDPGKNPSAPGFLLVEEAVEIKDYSVFKAGDTITYQMPKKPEGSRADIAALSSHADGQWTLMLSRKLDTGNEDDVAFNVKKNYSFAMALFDDSGDENSYDSEVVSLEFAR